MSFEYSFRGQPTDPIDFIYSEGWITFSSIGSIFTFALIAKFRETILDQIMLSVLPPESFEFMRVEIPDIGGPMKPTESIDSSDPTKFVKSPPLIIDFGEFLREIIIWLVAIMILYIMGIFIRWPGGPGGITFNTQARPHIFSTKKK